MPNEMYLTTKLIHLGFHISVWLIALSEPLPRVTQCTGIDIRLVQAQRDIFKPPPAEFVGSFDVVHIRHVHLVIKDNGDVPIVKNLRALLIISVHLAT